MQPLSFVPDGPTAKLRYVSTVMNDVTTLVRINVEQCPIRISVESIASTGPGPLVGPAKELSTVSMIGSTGKEDALIRERVVPADKGLVFKVWALRTDVPYNPGYSCENAGVFVPRADAEYEFTYKVEAHGIMVPTCEVSIVELRSTTDGQIVKNPESSARFFNPPKREREYCTLVN